MTMRALKRTEPIAEPVPVPASLQEQLDSAWAEQRRIRLRGEEMADNTVSTQHKLEELAIAAANGDEAALTEACELQSRIAVMKIASDRNAIELARIDARVSELSKLRQAEIVAEERVRLRSEVRRIVAEIAEDEDALFSSFEVIADRFVRHEVRRNRLLSPELREAAQAEGAWRAIDKSHNEKLHALLAKIGGWDVLSRGPEWLGWLGVSTPMVVIK